MWGRVVPITHVPAHAEAAGAEPAARPLLRHAWGAAPERHKRHWALTLGKESLGTGSPSSTAPRTAADCGWRSRCSTWLAASSRAASRAGVAGVGQCRGGRVHERVHDAPPARRRRRLDVWLVYLSRYLFCKTVSVDVRFALHDTLAALRPQLVLPDSYEQARRSSSSGSGSGVVLPDSYEQARAAAVARVHAGGGEHTEGGRG